MTKYEIQDAFSLLDEKVPGWSGRINLDRLIMISLRDCILGQLFGDYQIGLDALGISSNEDMQIYFAGRKSEWVSEIRRRRSLAVPAIHSGESNAPSKAELVRAARLGAVELYMLVTGETDREFVEAVINV